MKYHYKICRLWPDQMKFVWSVPSDFKKTAKRCVESMIQIPVQLITSFSMDQKSSSRSRDSRLLQNSVICMNNAIQNVSTWTTLRKADTQKYQRLLWMTSLQYPYISPQIEKCGPCRQCRPKQIILLRQTVAVIMWPISECNCSSFVIHVKSNPSYSQHPTK